MFRVITDLSNGKWIGNNKKGCKDPKKVFESIVPEYEDIFESIGSSIIYFDINKTATKPIPKTVWSNSDSLKFGRCWTMNLTSEQTQFGIKEIKINLKVND